MFGITYISYSTRYLSKSYAKDSIHSIELNSLNYDIRIVTASSDNISAVVDAKSFGYVLKENSEVKVKSEAIAGTLKINVTEPHGLAFKNSSIIELRIPKDYCPNIKITNKKGKTTIDDSALSINKFTYETSSGNLTFNAGSISDMLDLKLNNAKVNLGANVATNTMNVQLELSKGQFIANEHTFNTINVLKNTNGVVSVKGCSSFNSQAKSAGGKFVIGTANNVNIESSDTNVSIDKLNGGSIILTETGKVYIKEINGIVKIQTNSGSITVDKATESFMADSEDGDILINNATKKITSESLYGNITISFDKDAGDYNASETYPLRSAIATTKNGKITLTGVDNIRVGIVENGTGRADIKMRKVLGDNTVFAQRGEVVVTIPNTEIYHLTTESTEGGSVYVNVGQFAVNGYTTKEHTDNLICASGETTVTANNLTVTTTSGSLKVVDELNS